MISGLSHRIGWLEKIALSLILSVSFVSLVTPALSLFTSNYLFYSLAISLGLSAVLIGVFLLKNCTSIQTRPKLKIEEKWLPLAVALIGYAAFLLSLNYYSPYFPTAGTFDPIAHASYTEAILLGDGRNLLLHSASYPLGLHFVAAVISSTAGSNVLDSLRLLLSLVLIDILLLTYFAAREISGDERVAGIAVLVGAFAVPADLIHLTLVGAFPNIVADGIILALLWQVLSYVKHPNRRAGLTLALLGLAGVVVHSSIFILFVLFWAIIPIVFLMRRSQIKQYTLAALYSISGIVLLALVASSVLGRNVGRLLDTYFALSNANGFFLIAYLNLLWNFKALMGWGSATATALAIFFVLLKPRKSIAGLFMVVWIALLMIGAFVSTWTDRFVLFSMIPATFLVASLLGWGSELLATHRKIHIRTPKIRMIVVALVLLMLVAFGEFPRLAIAAYDPANRSRQLGVQASMEWLMQSNCPKGVASLGFWVEYRFLPTLTGVPYYGDLLYFTKPDRVFQKSVELGFSCVAMETGNQNFHLFEVDSRFQEKYRNDAVAIFLVT